MCGSNFYGSDVRYYFVGISRYKFWYKDIGSIVTCLRTLSVHGNVLLRTVLQVPKVGTVMYQQNTTYLLSITTKGIANYSQHKILPHHFTTRYSLDDQSAPKTKRIFQMLWYIFEIIQFIHFYPLF